jgi:hypothetical protein
VQTVEEALRAKVQRFGDALKLTQERLAAAERERDEAVKRVEKAEKDVAVARHDQTVSDEECSAVRREIAFIDVDLRDWYKWAVAATEWQGDLNPAALRSAVDARLATADRLRGLLRRACDDMAGWGRHTDWVDEARAALAGKGGK